MGAVSSTLIAKLGIPTLTLAMLSEFTGVDSPAQLIGLGVIGFAMFVSYRIVSAAREARVAEYERINQAIREENERLRAAKELDE